MIVAGLKRIGSSMKMVTNKLPQGIHALPFEKDLTQPMLLHLDDEIEEKVANAMWQMVFTLDETIRDEVSSERSE